MVHLNVKSNFSFGHGASTIDNLLERARELNIKVLALTDLNGFYGVVPFIKKAEKMGIRPISGVILDDPNDTTKQVVLLPTNLKGFGEVGRIITDRHLKDDFNLCSSLIDISPDVFVLSGNIEVLKAAEHQKYNQRLYGEIVYQSNSDSTKCRKLSDFCKLRGVPLVATNDVYFSKPTEYTRHKLLSAIFQNTDLERANFSANRESYLKPPEEIEYLYRKIPDLVRNTEIIAEQCEIDLELGKLKFPKYPLGRGVKSFDHLRNLSESGLRKRYSDNPSQDAWSRLHYELSVIERLGFTEYFLVVNDIKGKAVEWGMPYVGRGSAANSIVSYCLGFTEVDPIRHNLFFERFLNPHRKSPPDIDIDFSWKDRDRILNYVYDRYGHDRVAMICTTVTFAFRASVRETAKVMGLSEEEIGRVTKRIPHFADGDFDDIRRNNPESIGLPTDIEPWKNIFKHAQSIIGFPRHLSIHPSGIVIAPVKITDYVPLQRASKGFVVTQYDMYPVEDIGLVKIDLLSQRSLGVLTDTLNAVREHTTDELPMDDFNAICADPQTKELVRTGSTMGCFYIESPGMRALLKKLDCETFELLTAASSVIRPGVAESGMMKQFIDRHRDPEMGYEALHPMMEELLKDTHGVMIYQEDVIKVANQIAGIPLGEADLLRRAMSGKERSSRRMKNLHKRFVEGCIKNSVEKATAEEIWRQVESFAGYAFCKAHSASFAVLSFKVAYLKANYPAEFMAAVLSNEGGFYGSAAYIEETRRMGVEILLPDINLSGKEYTGQNNEMRIGFQAILNLHEETIDCILKARANGFFENLSDFLNRTGTGIKETSLLIKAGTFDFLGESRPRLLWKLEALKGGSRNAGGLFGLEETLLKIPRSIRDFDESEKYLMENRIFGYPVRKHPLDFVNSAITQSDNIISAAEIEAYRGRRVRMLGWAISHKKIRTKKSKEYMKFLSLEDRTGTFEVTLFPETYKKFATRTMSHGPYLVEGRIEDDSGVLSLVADRLAVV